MNENGVQTAKCIVEGEVWRQDYKMQTLVYPRVTVKAGMQERGTERGTEIKHPNKLLINLFQIQS